MFTSLKIHDVAFPQPADVFELCVTYMHGDADHYTKDKYYYHETEKETLLAHINFLVACMAKFPHGMGSNDGYWDVPGYEDFGLEWLPWDNEACSGHATVSLFKTFWIDENGTKFVVTPMEA